MHTETDNYLTHMRARVAFSPTCNLNCIYCGGSERRTSLGVPGAMEDFRRTPLETGSISTDEVLEILQALYEAGLRRICSTGGEPTLRRDWDGLITAAYQTGFKHIDITTNGTLLTTFLEQHGSLPQGLSMVKVSLDTVDPEVFRQLTGGGDLYKVIEGVTAVSQTVYTRADTVFMRRTADPRNLQELINFCQKSGMKQIMFLDLVHYPNLPLAKKGYWEKEFLPFEEFQKLMVGLYPGIQFNLQSSKGHFGVNVWEATISDGFSINFKDSTQTMRDHGCFSCPEFCQEGRCVIRIATDGNITFCPDYQGVLPDAFNGLEALRDGRFAENMAHFTQIMAQSEKIPTIEMFAEKHQLSLSVL